MFSVVGSQLTVLDMSGCHESMTDHALRSIVKHCTELENLSLSFCVRLTGEAFISLLRDQRRARNLTSLKLNGCKEVWLRVCKESFQSLPNFMTLFTAKFSGITTYIFHIATLLRIEMYLKTLFTIQPKVFIAINF